LSAGGAAAMHQPMPVIRKAQRLVGNHLILRNADVSDAEFIVRLRTDPQKRRYISPTSAEIAPQLAWLTQYAGTPNDAYFIAEDTSGDKIGTIRIYAPVEDSFCFGSWVMKDGALISHAVESLLMVYHYALDELGFNRSYFAVRKDNRSVWRFMERFGGARTRETDIDYWYVTQRAAVESSFQRLANLLPNGITVYE
jgi:RimJ/RimL family protein N-acetyltransferase